MFNKKLRRSLLLKEQMIANRDKVIKDINEDRQALKQENLAVYAENKELRYENKELLDTLNKIDMMCKTHTNPYTLIRDIKNELSTTATKQYR